MRSCSMSSANTWELILVPEVRDNILNLYRCLFTCGLKRVLSSCKKEISIIDDHGVIIASDKTLDFCANYRHAFNCYIFYLP